MKNSIVFNGAQFSDSRIGMPQAALDIDLSGRTLTVDTAVAALSVSAGQRSYPIRTSDGLKLMDANGRRLYTAQMSDIPTELSAWSQAEPVRILRGGSLAMSFFPRSLRRSNANRCELSMSSALGILVQMEHSGGIYDGTQRAGPLIREICKTVPVFVADTFENVPVYGWLPYVTPSGAANSRQGSAKDNLLRVCFFLNAVVHAADDGTIRVENISNSISARFGPDRVYRDNVVVEDLTPVTSVSLLEHKYIPGTERKVLFEGSASEGQKVFFSEPCSALLWQPDPNASATMPIRESGANYAVLSAGVGTLTGFPYIHTTREITRAVSEADTENIVSIEDETLVSIESSADVANRLAAYYACRERIECDAVIENEKPGAVVSIVDPVERTMKTACIEAISPLNFSRTLKGRIKALVGFEPWQAELFQEVHEVVSSSGTYRFPSNLRAGTEVQCILIGSGEDGTDGEDGRVGGSVYETGTSRNIEQTAVSISAEPGLGGEGGLGGTKGLGGKIYRCSILVDPDQTAYVEIGSGDTTVTIESSIYSSASGSRSETGYTDLTKGTIKVYALPGKDGVKGCDGGNGGSSRDGNNGQSIDGVANGGAGGAGKEQSGKPYPEYRLGGGGGSGAVATANGNNGSDASIEYGSGYATARTDGADGVDADPVPAPSTFGCGGNGGNGGSGGGGAGGGSMNHPTISNPNPRSITLTIEGVGGGRGKGSPGTPGVHGCAILIYRVPR